MAAVGGGNGDSDSDGDSDNDDGLEADENDRDGDTAMSSPTAPVSIRIEGVGAGDSAHVHVHVEADTAFDVYTREQMAGLMDTSDDGNSSSDASVRPWLRLRVWVREERIWSSGAHGVPRRERTL